MRVPDEVLQCVCFICVKSGDVYRYGGTGFFVSVPSEMYPKARYVYLITAKHCIEKAQQYGNLYLRLNKVDGKADMVKVEAKWLYSDREASDVAVLRFPSLRHVFQYKHIAEDMFATEERIEKQGIGVGDDLVITGLFTERYGNQRNIPIVRSGVIAAMPDEPLEDIDTGLEYNAYLAEVRSIGGLSGSPVFVFLGPARSLKGKITISQKIYLLGLVRGHWDIRHRGQPLGFTEDELQAVNMGIAIITPFQDALEIINGEELVRERKQADRQQAKSREPTEDTE
jgi:hypothetical protein